MSPISTTVWARDVAFEQVEAIAFDKDGTLIDLDAYWLEPARAWVREAARTDAVLASDLGRHLGLGTEKLVPGGPLATRTSAEIAQLTEAVLTGSGIDGDEAQSRTRRARHLVTEMAAQTQPQPIGDVAGSLKRLSGAGPALVVITADDRQAAFRTLEALGVVDLVDLVLAADDGVAPKPDPVVMATVAARLGIQAGAVLMVGDSGVDAETARAGGAAGFVLVAPTDESPPPFPVDAVVASIDELAVT